METALTGRDAVDGADAQEALAMEESSAECSVTDTESRDSDARTGTVVHSNVVLVQVQVVV